MPTVFHEELFRQRLTQGFWKTVAMIHWRDQRVCRVCVSCRKFDDSALVEHREMLSKLAKIGSIDFLVNRASPKHNR